MFTGGALIGYNWQMESLVLGFEADINYAGFGDDNEEDITDSINDVFNASVDDATVETSYDANWFGTLRGRLGFAADNFLFYGTGGLAFGHMEANIDIDVTDGGDTVLLQRRHRQHELGLDDWCRYGVRHRQLEPRAVNTCMSISVPLNGMVISKAISIPLISKVMATSTISSVSCAPRPRSASKRLLS